MELRPDQPLLHYRLAEKIGEGGMGVVWKARDTNLDRDVAIKILPEGLGAEPDRLARFEREAKILAALDHPNIASVYGLHEAGGQRFIAMEFVPGEDLAERLARGTMPVDDALDVGRQVAAALEAAHEQGVIHRDLKPANIKCTPEGKVKVLDLGLAKALVQETSGDAMSASLSPTITSAGTIAGTLLGTAAYMSPEQAKGKAVDRRADIWAFGVVLHEMLTSRRLFEAETISETLAAVLRDEIDLGELPARLPAPVAPLLTRCLDRNPRTRLRDIGEARIVLSPDTLAASGVAVGDGSAPGETPAPASMAARLLPWALVAILAVIAVLAMSRGGGGEEFSRLPIKLVATLPANHELPNDQMGALALSPDGQRLAVILRSGPDRSLQVRRLDGDRFVEVVNADDIASPFFSPDGQWIGFFSDEKLKKVSVDGGTPMTLCDAPGQNRGATWTDDDTIIFSPHYTKPLMRVSAAGGEAVELTAIDVEMKERTHRWPFAIPGEDLILYTVGTIDSPEDYDGARIDALRPSTGERKTVLERASMAWYVPTGHLVFGRSGFLMAVRFDLDTLETSGDPVPVFENVFGAIGSGIVHASFSQNGRVIYFAGNSGRRERRFVWRNRDGSTELLGLPAGRYGKSKFSPDRSKLAVTVITEDGADVWVYDLNDGTFTRITFEGRNRDPIWSPDGKLLAFTSSRGGAMETVYTKPADGSGQAELLVTQAELGLPEAGTIIPGGWTPDGKRMIVDYADEQLQNIGIIDLDANEITPLVATPAAEFVPEISPDGRWFAYTSDETGEFEVFVRAVDGSGRWQISSQRAGLPMWAPDGKTLYYLWPPRLHEVAVYADANGFRRGPSKTVFDNLPANTRVFDVFNDDRFLFAESAGNDTEERGVTVVVDWFGELERLVP